MSVPPEIIDLVFSFLQSDPTTLAICSRAHPSLSSSAERLLYADVVVFDNEGNTDKKDDRQTFLASELHRLLIDSPHIANYIRKLEICLSSRAATGIAPILPMLPWLDGIFVTATYYGYWQCLSTEFLDAFTNRLSSLKEVSIIYFDYFPLRVLDGCKAIKSIGLHRWADDWIHENDLQVVPPVLDSLSLRSWQPHSLDSRFMDWARKRIHSLRFLLFHSSNGLAVNVVLPELLRMCSNSLISLEVNLSDGVHSPMFVDLSSVPHLKDLTIRSNLHNTRQGRKYWFAFPAIIQLLETTLCLNNLTLKISNSPLYDELQFNLTYWSPLLTFFSRSSDKFRHIEIQLCHITSNTGHLIPSVDTLPRLYDSEIVSDLIAKGILEICTNEWKLY